MWRISTRPTRSSTGATHRSINTAFAALQESERRWREGDWPGVLALYDHDDFELDDRRSLMHMRASG